MSGNPNAKFVIVERREKVMTLLSQNMTEIEIARYLNVGHSTVCRDVKAIKKECQNVIHNIIEKILPYEFAKSLQSMNLIIKECWNIHTNKSGEWTNKDRLNALKLIKQATETKFELMCKDPLFSKFSNYKMK